MLAQYEDLERVATERLAEELSRKETKMDRKVSDPINPLDNFIHERLRPAIANDGKRNRKFGGFRRHTKPITESLPTQFNGLFLYTTTIN